MKSSFVAAIALALPLVSAHFTLDYPQTRGTVVYANEAQFCGGYPNAASPRQQYPLGSAPLIINSGHTAQIGIQISFDQNPASFANFNATSTGTPIPMLKGFALAEGKGIFCLNVDVASLRVPGVVDGTNATIQVIYNGGDSPLYQCSDVTLSSTFVPSNVSCTNVTLAAATTGAHGASHSATGTLAAAAVTPTARSAALGRKELGAVGAGLASVAAVVFVLV